MPTASESAAHHGARVVLITHPREGAERFSRRLVERGLAACVNRLDVRSTFRWEGAVQEEAEVLLVLKTVAARWEALLAFVAAEHPYDLPECVALAPREVEGRYLAWWTDAVSG